MCIYKLQFFNSAIEEDETSRNNNGWSVELDDMLGTAMLEEQLK